MQRILQILVVMPLLATCSTTSVQRGSTVHPLVAAVALGRRCSELGPEIPHYPAPLPRDPPGGWPAIEPKPPIFGCLDREVIRRVIRQQLSELICCRGALRSAATGVSVTLHFIIDSAGIVTDVSSHAEPESPALQACLAQVVSTWRWKPAGWKSVLVSYPLRI